MVRGSKDDDDDDVKEEKETVMVFVGFIIIDR